MKKIKIFILNFAKKNEIFRSVIRKMVFIIKRCRYLTYYFKKVNNKQIIFESFMGRKYVDSPKAIYEYMLSQKKYRNFTFIWAFKNPEDYQYLNKNHNTKVIKYNSKEYYKVYSTSKYWITNSRVPDVIVKKKNQIYVQCWHGTPLKKLGFDITVQGGNALNSLKDIRYKYQVDSKKYTYMVSPSKFCSEKFISAFNLKAVGKEDIIIEQGYPRNDYLVNYQKKDIDKIKSQLNLPTDKKILLYAPTWRDNQHQSGVGYTYKTEVDFDYLKKKLSKDYIILFRAHYFVANSFDFEKYQGFIYNVSDYNDINDLYVISDTLITDYSSVFFDYAILKRPMIFYMYDLNEYKNKLRDFYFDLSELPGPIIEKEEELVNSIVKLTKSFKYDQKYQDFNNKYNYLDDGLASKRVIEVIIEEEDLK